MKPQIDAVEEARSPRTPANFYGMLIQANQNQAGAAFYGNTGDRNSHDTRQPVFFELFVVWQYQKQDLASYYP